MMRRNKFKQVDVFTRVPYLGNPVAVVLEAEGLDVEEMQRIATWTNLSETTFVSPASSRDADYRLRIFTPNRELPFAGHPTVGSAHAILEAGLVKPKSDRLIQECGVGIVELEIKGSGPDREILVTSPDARITACPESLLKEMDNALGIKVDGDNHPLIVDVGPRWLVVDCNGKEYVRRINPDFSLISSLSKYNEITGVTVFGITGEQDVPVYVRSFAPAEGIPEDPVCGSGNISVGAYLLHKGLLQMTGNNYTAIQGLEMEREGYVRMNVDPVTGVIKMGGNAVTCIDGYISC